MGILLHQKWILLVLLSVTEATIMKNKFSKLKPGQSIRGHAKVELMTRSRQECALRCLDDRNYFAYQYKKSASVNCILIQKDCSDVEEHIFENNTYTIIYEKDSKPHVVNKPTSDEAWNPPSNWNGPEAVLYRHFDNSSDLAFLEGTQQMNIVPLVSGKVNAAVSLNGTRKQWVDLGIHTDACMTDPRTCGAAGGAISLWVNVEECGGIISAQAKGLKGLRFFCSRPFSPGVNFNFIWLSLSDSDMSSVALLYPGWTHIVLNYVGPNNGEEIIVFINGVQVKDNTVKVSNNTPGGDGRIVVSRCFTFTDEEYATVQVDELIFFNQTLSNDNVNALYNDV